MKGYNRDEADAIATKLFLRLTSKYSAGKVAEMSFGEVNGGETKLNASTLQGGDLAEER